MMGGFRPHLSDPRPQKGAVMHVEIDQTAEHTPTQYGTSSSGTEIAFKRAGFE